MTEAVLSSDSARKSPVAEGWSLHLRLLGIAVAAILLLHWREAVELVGIWWHVSTYNHCLVVIPIIAWLVQQRSEELAKIRPAIWTPGLAWVALGGLTWLLGEAASVALGRHLALILMLQGTVVTLLGRAVALGLVFPLAYAFFLVPVGEEIVPQLQMVTADLTMLFLGWTDIPAYIEGVFITTPTGYFEVAEACSGVMFLIAMIAFGALVANLCFRSWSRRIGFMALCIIVPIVANGIRAFGTIYISHFRGIEFAAGFDHIFYGWFFFAFVLIAVVAMGWRFFDRGIAEPMIDGDRLAALPYRSFALRPALAGLAATLILPVGWSALIAAQVETVPETVAMPEVPGWERIEYNPIYPWQPRFDGADSQQLIRYRNADSGATVDLAVALYADQSDGREIVGYGQGALDPASQWAWTRDTVAPAGGKAEQFTAPGPVLREVATFYRIGDKLTGSATHVKLETLKNRLLGGDSRAVAVLVSAERIGDSDPRAAIDAFLTDLGDVAKVADESAGRR